VPDDPVLASTSYLLLKAGTQMNGIVEDALAAYDLTPRQFLVLTFARRPEALSQLDLSKRLGLDPTIVVGLIDELEARTAIRRVRDETDRRRSLLEVTPTGTKLHAKAMAAMQAAEDEFLAPLPVNERSELRRMLLEVMRSRLAWLGPPTDD
jgi:DNA-binding MarR family transcriptional regulator